MTSGSSTLTGQLARVLGAVVAFIVALASSRRARLPYFWRKEAAESFTTIGEEDKAEEANELYLQGMRITAERYLDGDEMEALLERRKLLLAHVDRLLEERPNAEVFFSSSEGE